MQNVGRVGWYDALASVGIAAVGLSRAWAYSPFGGPPHEGPGVLIMTDNGRFLPVLALVWLAVGLWALWDGFVKDTGWSEAIFFSLMAVWGASYGVAWLMSGFGSPDWLPMFMYLGIATHTLARYLENARQARLVNFYMDRSLVVATGSLPVKVDGRDV